MPFTKFDEDIKQTTEWIQALYDVYQHDGSERAQYILARLGQFYLRNCGQLELATDYSNTLPESHDNNYPDTGGVAEELSAWIGYNALAMVLQAGDYASELGGHLATYASIAKLYEVGFNYFFRGRTQDHLEDLVYFQGHSSPGIYARSCLTGKLSENLLKRYRQEALSPGLSSYPHPWLMPDYWSFPTVSMGLGPYTSVYQARFLHYLENRGLLAVDKKRHVWVYCGDGEMDEPESVGALGLAGREKLDNLIFVINCNLQRLDGPVRGNYKVIQELEVRFLGNGWHVIKVLWNSAWDELFKRDQHGYLRAKLMQIPDGEMQSYGHVGGRSWQHDFFASDPVLKKLTSDWKTEDFAKLECGGHDVAKIYAAYKAAVSHTGQPVVILAQTVKGHGLGAGIAGANVAHQKKKMKGEERIAYVNSRGLPISEEDAAAAKICLPPSDSKVAKFLQDRVAELGHVPSRYTQAPKLQIPDLEAFKSLLASTNDKEISTTMAFVRILNILLKDKNISRYLVPIIPDEARTFGMEGLFRQIGIYSPIGQTYEPVDKGQLMYYRESVDGQVLQEGINEAGGISSWMAAATSYSSNAIPMIPFYIYYSMFGFQRVGDFAWAAADMRARGFLVGATAGRTTLSGEGLQHTDGHSHVMANVIPNCLTYDPCFAYELAVIIREGLRRMYVEQEDVFYYLTVMNENYTHPEMPFGVEDDIIKGMYLLQYPLNNSAPDLNLLGSGAILNEVSKAQEILANDYGVSARVWSVTSFNQLGRDIILTTEENARSGQDNKQSFVAGKLNDLPIPTLAATDYVRAYPEQIRAALHNEYHTLGTDGFGCSDTRKNMRKYFAVDANSIVLRALWMLSNSGKITRKQFEDAQAKLTVYDERDYIVACHSQAENSND